jgi:hypothetical protein
MFTVTCVQWYEMGTGQVEKVGRSGTLLEEGVIALHI